MTVPNVMSKAFYYQDLRRVEGGTMCSPPSRGMIRQGEDRVIKTLASNSFHSF